MCWIRHEEEKKRKKKDTKSRGILFCAPPLWMINCRSDANYFGQNNYDRDVFEQLLPTFSVTDNRSKRGFKLPCVFLNDQFYFMLEHNI